tara:strand:- start:1452 stop:2564 length:1113 start_codon:yes stop_codon:yes gene_type:complete
MGYDIAPKFIIKDNSNNHSYWLYKVFDSTEGVHERAYVTSTELKSLAKLNNFDFESDVNVSVISSGEVAVKINEQLVKDKESDVGLDNNPKIAFIFNSTVKQMFGNALGGDTQNVLYTGAAYNDASPFTEAGNFESQYNSGSDLGGEDVTYAIFLKNENDKGDKYYILNEQVRKNVIESDNQHRALQYMYMILIGVTVLTLMFNYNNVKLSHIVFFVFFVGYGFFYKYISTFIISQFKSALKSVKTSDTITQMMLYIKIVMLTLVAISIPLISLTSFGENDVGLSEISDYTSSITENIMSQGSDLLESAQNTISDNMEGLKDSLGNAREGLEGGLDYVKDGMSNIGDNIRERVDNTFGEGDARQPESSVQ